MRNRFEKDGSSLAVGGGAGLGERGLGARLGTSLSPAEREVKQGIFRRVVKMLDLSLLGALGDQEARKQIRETCEPEYRRAVDLAKNWR